MCSIFYCSYIFFFFSRFEANQTRKSKSQRMRRSGKSAKCLSYLFVWYIHSLLLESHHSLGLCFFFLGSCGVYIPIWFLENKTKWEKKCEEKNTHIPNCAVFLLKNFLRCTLYNAYTVYYLFRAFFLCAHRTQTYTCIHQQQVNRCGNRLFSNKSCIVIIPMERHNY